MGYVDVIDSMARGDVERGYAALADEAGLKGLNEAARAKGFVDIYDAVALFCLDRPDSELSGVPGGKSVASYKRLWKVVDAKAAKLTDEQRRKMVTDEKVGQAGIELGALIFSFLPFGMFVAFLLAFAVCSFVHVGNAPLCLVVALVALAAGALMSAFGIGRDKGKMHRLGLYCLYR